MAEKTVTAYQSDMLGFARWFTDTTGEAFCASAVTPTDILDYKAHLRTVQRRQAATVNRRLAALRKLFLWAQGTGRITDVPTAAVKGVASAQRSPKSLAKRGIDRLLREAERAGNKRNLTILLLLRHTGLRVGELCKSRLRVRPPAVAVRRGALRTWCGRPSFS
jgi:integrase/recombinase XerC